jgi:hypothetical protein
MNSMISRNIIGQLHSNFFYRVSFQPNFVLVKNLSISIVFFLLCNVLMAQKASDDFTGKWKAPKGDVIRVYKTKRSFIGKTVKEGVVVLKDVKFADGKWTAIILNPRENIVADCELILESGKLKIIAKLGVFQRTLYWVKV